MMGLIFLPLMPPESLMALTKGVIAARCAPYSASPWKPEFDAKDAKFDTGKTTLMVVVVKPRLEVDPWAIPPPLAPSTAIVGVLVPLFPVDLEWPEDVMANTPPPITAITTTTAPICAPADRRRSRFHDRFAAGARLPDATMCLPASSARSSPTLHWWAHDKESERPCVVVFPRLGHHGLRGGRDNARDKA